MSVVVHPNGAVVVEHLAPGFIYKVTISSAGKNTGDIAVQVSVSREGRQAVSRPRRPRKQQRPRMPNQADMPATATTIKELDIELLEYMAVAPRGDAQYEELKTLAESDPRARRALDRVNDHAAIKATR